MRIITSLFLVFVLGLGVSCSESPMTTEGAGAEWSGSGVLISEQRELSSFNSIHASGPVTTVITEGDNYELVVTADDNIISRVTTEVKGSMLFVSLKDGNYHNIWIRVQVTLPKIMELTNSGNGSMQLSGIHSDGSLKLTNSGSGTVLLDGAVKQFEINNEGTGTINGFNLKVNHCHITNEGSGSCELFCTDQLEGRNTGSGSILYKGNAAVNVQNTGSGSVYAAS